MTSFSWAGTPYGSQDVPWMLSHSGPVTFTCVKVISIPLKLTPRSVSKCSRFTFAPTKTRPRPSVWARSANTGPGEAEVLTGTPPSKRNVEPPLVALTGTFATLPLIALLMNEMRVPFSARAEGMKWSACSAVAESEPAVPPRKSGSWPAVKMNSSEILSRRPCALRAVVLSASARKLHSQHRIGPPSPGCLIWSGRRDAARGIASTPHGVQSVAR